MKKNMNLLTIRATVSFFGRTTRPGAIWPFGIMYLMKYKVKLHIHFCSEKSALYLQQMSARVSGRYNLKVCLICFFFLNWDTPVCCC
jgi:hypothetical protein